MNLRFNFLMRGGCHESTFMTKTKCLRYLLILNPRFLSVGFLLFRLDIVLFFLSSFLSLLLSIDSIRILITTD